MLKFRKSKFNYREEEFGGLVINIETGKIFKLNRTGYKLFLALCNGISEKKLIKKLEKEFKINKKKIKTDIKQFIDEVINTGLASKN